MNLQERLVHLLDDLRRKPVAGFIEQQQFRLQHQRATDRDHLLLAARQGAREDT